MLARLRMIDANANRAREALRVMEDTARFVLSDGALSGELKSLRHDLRAALDGAGLDEAALLASRDTPGDVGAALSTSAEGRRDTLRAVAAAAGKRLTEALRTLEECVKIGQHPAGTGIGGVVEASAAFERLRYRAYEAERRVLAPLGGGRALQWRLCVLLTGSLCLHHPWERVAAEAAAGGADCLQLREKSLPDSELLDRARLLVGIARSFDPRPAVVVNDRPDIALLAGADGVHLGQGDLPVREARRLAGSALLIGVSTQNMDQARAAAASGADGCGVGPMFPTTTTHKPLLAGPAYLREYLADPSTARLPHLAIGGITPENIGVLTDAGCRGVAVSSSVCGASDPDSVCRSLRAALDAAGRGASPAGVK